jgi:hypothetical protein
VRAIAPSRSLSLTIVARSCVIWLGTRALVSAVLFTAGVDPRRLDPIQTSVVVMATVVVAAVDSHRKHERLLLGNLGISPIAVGAWIATTALLGELAVRLLLA